MEDLLLRAKWSVRVGDRRLVLTKKRNESSEHVLVKALLWALYLPDFSDLSVEISIGDKYKPDVVQLDATGAPTFWGESGQVGKRKLEALLRRYRVTHFAFAKWSTSLRTMIQLIQPVVERSKRSAPVDVIYFPPDSAQRFLRDDGEIIVSHNDLQWIRLTPPL